MAAPLVFFALYIPLNESNISFFTIWFIRRHLNRNELYHRLFNQLQTHFSALFMPKATMAEDVHVWRFLAAMAVGATVDQQHVLVTEVR